MSEFIQDVKKWVRFWNDGRDALSAFVGAWCVGTIWVATMTAGQQVLVLIVAGLVLTPVLWLVGHLRRRVAGHQKLYEFNVRNKWVAEQAAKLDWVQMWPTKVRWDEICGIVEAEVQVFSPGPIERTLFSLDSSGLTEGQEPLRLRVSAGQAAVILSEERKAKSVSLPADPKPQTLMFRTVEGQRLPDLRMDSKTCLTKGMCELLVAAREVKCGCPVELRMK